MKYEDFINEDTPFRLFQGYAGDGKYLFSHIRDVPKSEEDFDSMKKNGIKRKEVDLDLVWGDSGLPEMDKKLGLNFAFDMLYYLSPDGSIIRSKYRFAGRYEFAGIYIDDLLESKNKFTVDIEAD